MSAYAVIKTGGKQYRVAEDDVLVIEKLADEDGEPRAAGDEIVFDQVLMLGGENTTVGAPLVAGAAVTAEVVEQRRAPKITIIKTRQRNTYKRTKGHRQPETVVRITGISADGAPTPKKAKKKAAPAADSAPAAAAVKFLDAPDGAPDDLSLIGGVGPKIAEKLNGLGIYHFRQIAAFTPEDVAKVDEVLNFKGRIEREDWIAQAQELAAGGEPRAAVDKAKKAHDAEGPTDEAAQASEDKGDDKG